LKADNPLRSVIPFLLRNEESSLSYCKYLIDCFRQRSIGCCGMWTKINGKVSCFLEPRIIFKINL